MRSTRQQARIAGLLYAFMIVTGLPGLILIPGRLIVDGDAAATADHIRAAETLFRVGIASELFHQVVYLYLALALYRLFESVNRSLAVQMVMLVAVSVPIVFVNTLNELATLLLVTRPSFLSTFSTSQLDSLAYLFVRMREQGYGIVEVFWGLWLVPFGLLVMRSGFLPRFLGVLLLVAVLGNLLRVVNSLFPALDATVLHRVAGMLALGELPIILWLLIGRVSTEPTRVPAAP